MEKIRVAWICHFTNAEIQSLLPLWKLKNELASWIPNTLKGFENNENIELHVVSPHEHLKHAANFTIRNIHYHFIPYGLPISHSRWPGVIRFDVFSNFYSLRRKVMKTIDHIQPDLINLIGTENAYYSSSILDFKNKYPVLVTIQGFISQMKSAVSLIIPAVNKNMNVEKKILQSFKYYASEQDSFTYISKFNPNNVFFRIYFPVNENLVLNTLETVKKYDCIYFGTLTKLKGAEDFIKVIAELKTLKPDIKACIVGGGKEKPLVALANRLNCAANIEFTGFMKTQKELFEYVKASKVFLAPPYFERLSSTIREAMFLKVPIVAYATGGIPYINEFDENIYLVKTGDYKEMARRTLLLIENEALRNSLAGKAYKYANREFSLKANTERLFSAYQAILNDTKNK